MALENILYGIAHLANILITNLKSRFLARAFNSEHQVGGWRRFCTSKLQLIALQMELINECSLRFAEDKDFRLLVRLCMPVIRNFAKDQVTSDCRQYHGTLSR